MEYKRSRLDLDSNSILTNSSSPSPMGVGLGGSGSSVSGDGGGGPFRGRYTRPQPSAGGLNYSGLRNRFSPYSINRDRPSSQRRSVPFIRARMDEEKQSTNGDLPGFASASTTAQKIMETLASMSTPVLNAGRVRIDSIKTLKPHPIATPMLNSSGTFLSASSKFSGPPKTLSPLLVPKSPSGLGLADKSSWPLKCLSIPPRMVDCGINTEEILKCDEDVAANSKSPVAATPVITKIGMTQTQLSDVKISLMEMIARCKSVNGEYKWDKAWSLKSFDRYLESNQYNEDIDDEEIVGDDNDNQDKAGDNMDDDEQNSDMAKTRESIAKAKEENIKLPNGVGAGGEMTRIESEPTKKKTELWACVVCPSDNEFSSFSCTRCGSPRPREFDTNYEKPTEKLKTEFKFQPIFTSGLLSAKKSTETESNSAPSFQFPTGASFSNTTSTTNTTSGPTPSTIKNDIFVVTSSSFNTSIGGDSPDTAAKSTEKPQTTLTPTTSFQFGNTSSVVTPASNQCNVTPSSNVGGFPSSNTSTGGFSFGSPAPVSNSINKPSANSFSFGVPNINPSPGPPAMFQFSANPSTSTSSDSSKPREFGASYEKPVEKPKVEFNFQPMFSSGSLTDKKSTETISAPNFQFGTPAPSTTSSIIKLDAFRATPNTSIGSNSLISAAKSTETPQTTLTPTPSFQFGASGAGFIPPSNQFNLTPNFNFGASSSNTSTGGFSFGSPAPVLNSANSFSFGAPTPPNPNPSPGPPIPSLFQFSANPSTATGPERKFKRAVRRNRY